MSVAIVSGSFDGAREAVFVKSGSGARDAAAKGRRRTRLKAALAESKEAHGGLFTGLQASEGSIKGGPKRTRTKKDPPLLVLS